MAQSELALNIKGLRQAAARGDQSANIALQFGFLQSNKILNK